MEGVKTRCATHRLNKDNTVRALSKLALNGIVNRLHTHVIIIVVVDV